MKILLLTALNAALVLTTPTNFNRKTVSENSCGYESCPQIDPNALNVHIVPHSHDDVGWLKTVDQYYWGANNTIQHAGVQYIIDSVVTALEQNPERRFIQVETAFFYQWWKEQNESQRERFRKLVNTGRLEIINGAWSMNDEAAVNYQSVIDQFTLGLRIINDTLGICGRPKIGWQIDPFGHSREMASIYSQMGYDALLFARLDWRDKSTRLSSKTGEMLWQGDPNNIGDNSNLFTSVLFNHYSAPAGYCFDILCSDSPIVDNVNSSEYNYREKVEGYAAFIRTQANYYATNNIIITMGDDFNYQDALSYYKNLDKLIEGFKEFPQYHNNRSINVFYSTPSCYIKAVNEEAARVNLAFPLKTDDFFPYANSHHTYWSGYYTSRPNSKRFERQGNNILQVTKQLATFIPQNEDTIPELRSLQEAMGTMQHHDAITGTEKQHVANDYHRILAKAIKKSIGTASKFLSILLPITPARAIDLELETCLLANVSICPISQSNEFVAAIYNPLSRPVSHYVRLPVKSSTVKVEGENGESITTQVLPAIDSFSHLSEANPASLELVFLAESIPPLGAKLFKVTVDTTTNYDEINIARKQFKIGNEINGVDLDPLTGLLQKIVLNGVALSVTQQFMFYYASTTSGAYIFRPTDLFEDAVPFNHSVEVKTYSGDLVEEFHQTVSPWVKQIIRLYRNATYVEFDWLVGPISESDGIGREVISRFATSLNTDDIFYTDANGRQMVRRQRNHRETFQYTNEEPIAGNYYPVTSKILLKDTQQNIEFAVLNDRAQGGSSLASGQVELMVHRRLFYDDNFGVGEPLNETEHGYGIIARGQHYVTFGASTVDSGKTSSAIQREIAQEKLLSPWIFVTQSSSLWDKINKKFSGLTNPLPENVQILTLEPWKYSENTLLLRLEHILEKGEDPTLSKPVTVNLDGLFSYFDIDGIQEMTLAGDQALDNNVKLEWIIGDNLTNLFNNDTSRRFKYEKPSFIRDMTIVLNPMEIRTFLVSVTYNAVEYM